MLFSQYSSYCFDALHWAESNNPQQEAESQKRGKASTEIVILLNL